MNFNRKLIENLLKINKKLFISFIQKSNKLFLRKQKIIYFDNKEYDKQF